ncbi:DUF6238 family protein [Streptomyces daliensis]|uniref:Uncharacterized protein n=1 Tax=Streptomyces daliensis TaxID=299421 RepID=A0A8T4IW41_9ACTN|nr:hypothetical protein [Streptomyces daliensis]
MSRHRPLATVDATVLPRDEHAVRSDIDQLHAEALALARRMKQLSTTLNHGDYCAAGGRLQTGVGHVWRAAEELHSAFHTAPPRCAGPDASLALLCRRRMRYLAARVARRAA